ncbi:putative oxidoreductase SSP0419 [Aphomia sociella]
MDYIDFKGKVVIVTGASSGIGANAAKAFAVYGAKLTLVGRDESRLLAVAKQCEPWCKSEPLCILLDLTQPGNCEIVIEKTIQAYGQINILVNCAGKRSKASMFDTSMNDFDEQMNINVRVPVLLTKLALPHLVKSKGNVVNVVSAFTKRYKENYVAYTVTKSALEKFTYIAAPELMPHGVRINAVSPGITKDRSVTDLYCNGQVNSTFEALDLDLPAGTVKDIVLMIVMIASDVFPNMNGSNTSIDSGTCMM